MFPIHICFLVEINKINLLKRIAVSKHNERIPCVTYIQSNLLFISFAVGNVPISRKCESIRTHRFRCWNRVRHQLNLIKILKHTHNGIVLSVLRAARSYVGQTTKIIGRHVHMAIAWVAVVIIPARFFRVIVCYVVITSASHILIEGKSAIREHRSHRHGSST